MINIYYRKLEIVLISKRWCKFVKMLPVRLEHTKSCIWKILSKSKGRERTTESESLYIFLEGLIFQNRSCWWLLSYFICARYSNFCTHCTFCPLTAWPSSCWSLAGNCAGFQQSWSVLQVRDGDEGRKTNVMINHLNLYRHNGCTSDRKFFWSLNSSFLLPFQQLFRADTRGRLSVSHLLTLEEQWK